MVKLPFKNHPHISQVLTSALLFYCTVWRLHKQTLALHFPQGIWALRKLQVLDVAGNKLFMFPVRVCDTLEFSSTRLWHSEIKKKKRNCNFAAWHRTFLCAVSPAAPEGAPLWRQQVCALWADVGGAGRRGALVKGKLMFQHLTITHNIIHFKEITSLFLLHFFSARNWLPDLCCWRTGSGPLWSTGCFLTTRP